MNCTTTFPACSAVADASGMLPPMACAMLLAVVKSGSLSKMLKLCPSPATRSGADELDQDALDALFLRFTYTGRFDRDEREIEQVRGARGAIKQVWTAPLAEAVQQVNAMLENASPYLAKHDH